MSLDTTTTETADPADFIGLRNISTSSSFINYTMFDFNGDEVEDTEEELYRDRREIKRLGFNKSILSQGISTY